MSSAVLNKKTEFRISKNASKQEMKATLSKATVEAAMTQNPVEVQVATN